MEMDSRVSTKVAAKMIGIHYLTLMKHVHAGTIQSTRMGRNFKITVVEVERIRAEGLPMLPRASTTQTGDPGDPVPS